MNVKEKAIFVLEVGLAFAAIYLIQKKVIAIPVIGPYLPGGQ